MHDRVWKDAERRVVASYTKKDRTFRTWIPRFFESRGKQYCALPRDIVAALTQGRCREVVFYEGRGPDRIKHSVLFETFKERSRMIDHEGAIWPSLERMYLHTAPDPATRKTPSAPAPAQPFLL